MNLKEMVLIRRLYNRRFRVLLFVALGIPLAIGYLYQTTILPWLDPTALPPHDVWVYLDAAQQLVNGKDPYYSVYHPTTPDPTFNLSYVYPPLLAWLLQPVVAYRGHGFDVAQQLLMQVSFLACLFLLLRMVKAKGWEITFFFFLLFGNWYSMRINLIGQVNIQIMLLGLIWLFGYTQGDRWWSGISLGVAIAVKFLLAPLLVLSIWGRRWYTVVAAIIAWAICWIPGSQYLGEYLFRVFPALGSGTGFRENQAPAGTISRLLHPANFFGQDGPAHQDVKIASLVVSVLILILVLMYLKKTPRTGRLGRLLEASLIFAAMPFVLTLQTPSQYVTIMIPMVIFFMLGLRLSNARLIFSVLAVWAITGPVHSGFLYALSIGYNNELILRLWAECGLVGLILLFVTAVYAIREYDKNTSWQELPY